jgi:hypothetical protein
MRPMFLPLGLFLVAAVAIAQDKPASQPTKVLFAVTEEGQRVKLLPDGTWVTMTEGPDKKAASTAKAKADFRKVKWGWTQKKVKATEGKLSAATKEYLFYETQIQGLTTTLGYTFVNDTLVSSAYLINMTENSNQDFMDNYIALKDTLTEKYGEPTKTKVAWSDETYKDSPEKWDLALALDDVAFITSWLTATTEIDLLIRNSNSEVVISVIYNSISHKSFVQEKKKSADDL